MQRISYGVASAWKFIASPFKPKSLSFRQMTGRRKHQPSVIAVGVDSLNGLHPGTRDNIARLIIAGHSPVIIHSNRRQISALLKQNPDLTIAECSQITQIEIGNKIREDLILMPAKYFSKGARIDNIMVTNTQVIIGHQDPAFAEPSIPVGPEYTTRQIVSGKLGKATKMSALGKIKIVRGIDEIWIMQEVRDKIGVYRRVVAAPSPVQIHPKDLAIIIDHIRQGKTVITAAQPNVPDALVDYKQTAALLTKELRAKALFIENEAVERSYFHAQQVMDELINGNLPVGATKTEVEAAVSALRFGTNLALLARPNADWTKEDGMLITRGVDFEDRLGFLVRGKHSKLQHWG